MAEMLWNVDKVLPGELEKKQSHYIKEAMEMARRAASAGINVNFNPTVNIDVDAARNESTVNIITDNSDKKIAVTKEGISFADTVNTLNASEAAEDTEKTAVQSDLKKIVEEKIVKSIDEDKSERVSELSDLHRIIENEIASVKGVAGDKSQSLHDLKTVIENEIEMMGKEGADDKEKKTFDEEAIDLRKMSAKKDDGCDVVDVRKMADAKRIKPMSFSAYIDKHNSSVNRKDEQGGDSSCRDHSKKN